MTDLNPKVIDWFKAQREQQAAGLSFALSNDDSNPDEMAEIRRVGSGLGLPAAVVQGDHEGFRRELEVKTNSSLLGKAPKTADWLRDHENGALAKDDLSNLTWFEQNTGAAGRALGRGVRRLPSIPAYGEASVNAGIAADVGKSFDQIYADEIAKFPGSESNPTIQADARRKAQFRFDLASQADSPERFLTKGADALSEARAVLDRVDDIPMSKGATAFKGTLADAENSLMGVLSAFVADPVGGASFVAETAAEFLPVMLAASATTAATRNPAAGIAVMSGGSFLVENSQSAMEFLEKRGVDLSTPEAAMAVMSDEALMAEAKQHGVTRGMVIAIMDGLSGGVAGQTLMKSAAGDAAAQVVAQVLFGSGGEALAQAATGEELDWRDIVTEGLAEIVTAPIEVGGVAGRWAFGQAGRAAKSGKTAEHLAEVDKQSAMSKLKQRAPDKFRELLERFEGQSLYVPADDMVTLFQAKDMDFEAGAAAYGLSREDFEEMLASGGDVAIPQAVYAERISGTEDAEWFHSHATMDPDGEMPLAEAEEFNARVRDVMREAFDEAERQRLADLESRAGDQQVFDEVYSQLRAAGRTAETAKAEAAPLAAFARTMAERSGYGDALDILRRFGLRVEGPQSPQSRLRGNLDIALNTIRSGKKQKPGRSLRQFVKDEGGLQDAGGEFEAADMTDIISERSAEIRERRAQPSMLGPVAGKGVALDEMARKAAEAGYFPALKDEASRGTKGESTDMSRVLMDALLSGEDAFIPGEEGDTDLAALEAELSRRGLDISQPNDELIAALDQPGEGEFNQDGTRNIDTQAFRDWFGDSKVVDESGEPLVVYHGTRKGGFGAFDVDGRGKTSGTGAFFTESKHGASTYSGTMADVQVEDVAAIVADPEAFNFEVTEDSGEWTAISPDGDSWTSTDREQAIAEVASGWVDSAGSQDANYSVYLSLQNPKVIDAGGQNWDSIGAEPEYFVQNEDGDVVEYFTNEADAYSWAEDEDNIEEHGYLEVVEETNREDAASTDDLVREARDEGYDGVIFENITDEGPFGQGYGWDNKIFVAFAPEQIKSVNNRGTFDPNDPRILYQSDAEFAAYREAKDVLDQLWDEPDIEKIMEGVRGKRASGGALVQALTNADGGVELSNRDGTLFAAVTRSQSVPDGWRVTYFDDRGFSGHSEAATKQKAIEDALESGYDTEAAGSLREAMKSRKFFQGRGAKRASITFDPNGEAVIRLFETADLSSFLHETGHYFLEAFNALSSDASAPEQIRADMDVIRKFVGNEGGAFTTEQHETFARGFEAYAMEGKAPSLELADAFARFKAWLTRIYQTVRGLNVKMSPEIREVFDRMLATDEEIRVAREAQQMRPLFAKAPPGMGEAAWNTYQRMARRSAEEAEAKLRDKTMAKIRREKEAWWKSERKEVKAQVTGAINSRREYRLIEALANGQWIDGDREVPDMQMDRDQLVDIFGEGVLAELSRTRLGGKRAIYTKGGEPVEVVADFFGFANASEMVEVLQNTIKRRDAIERETDRIMSDRYGDPLNDGSIESEALDAIHAEQQALTVASEARHLAGKAGLSTRNMTARIFRQRARAMLGRMSVREAARPDAFLAAERKAARRAEEAFAKSLKGDETALGMAARHKEQQLLNHYLYMEARDLKTYVDRGRERMRAYDKKSVREKLEGGYIEQIDALLDQYDFRKRSQGQVNRAESLNAFVQRMTEEGREAELSIDTRLMDEARRIHYTRLSVDELRGLFDTIDNIDHLGRFKQKLIEAKRKRDLNESVDRVIAQVTSTRGRKDPAKQYRGLQFLNLIRRPDTIMVSLDDGKELGPVYDELKQSIDEGQAREQEMGVQMVERMDALFARHYDAKQLRQMQKPTPIPGETTREWTKAEILSVALNTGNENNFQRLMDPNVNPDSVMTQDRLNALLSKLDANDWAFVQGMWDEVDSLWPDLAEIHRRRTGVAPEKVSGKMMVDAPSGVKGGYYPIKYDPTRGALAAKDEGSAWDKYNTAGHGANAAVANGMTKQRQASGGGRTLLFDLSVPFQHMRETVRYIALSEAVDASHRILNHPRMVETMQQTGQADTLKTLNLWLKDTARGPIFNTDLLNSSARFVKNNFTLSRLAFNMKTVALQATGLGQSAAVIGKRNMARGMMAYLRHPQGMISDVTERSAFMAERQSTFQKDIYDFINDTKTASPLQSRWKKGKQTLAKAGFYPMIKMQFLVVDVPTWVGAYDAALREGKTEDQAAHYADRMVARAQDSGLFADRAAVERGTVSDNVKQADFIRLFTTLAGYMLTKQNRAQVTLMQARAGIRETDASLGKIAVAASAASDLMLLFAFEAVAMGIIYSLMTDEEDDDDLTKFLLEETGMAMVGGIPMIRDAASAFRGYGGGGVYGSVLEAPSKLAIQAAQGEADGALFRAIGDIGGLATGLPTTATLRGIEALIDPDRSAAEGLFGRNPLTK